MRKSLLILLPILLLSACGSGDSKSSDGSVETDKTQRYEFDLTEENLWYFVDYSFVTSSTVNTSTATLIYSFKGALSIAYYENVVIHLNYHIVGKGQPGDFYYPSTTHDADIEVKLDAGGCGYGELPYNYIPENAIPEITQNDLTGFYRSLSLTSVTGKIHFAI